MSNGIKVTLVEDREIVLVEMFIDDQVKTWVEFNGPQLERLLVELAKVRLKLAEEEHA